MSPCCRKLSPFLVVLSFASILGSIAIWYLSKGASAEEVAHAERFGIFVGLWAPTFLGLANYIRGTCTRGSNSAENSCCAGGSALAEEKQSKSGCCGS